MKENHPKTYDLSIRPSGLQLGSCRPSYAQTLILVNLMLVSLIKPIQIQVVPMGVVRSNFNSGGFNRRKFDTRDDF